MGEKHWVVQAGLSDSPPDDVEVCWDREYAIQTAEKWFDLTVHDSARLDVFGHCYLDVIRHGADWVEVWECDCASPHLHYGMVERRQWAKESESRIRVTIG